MKTLFTRLVSYSQNPEKQSFENFVTEILGFLINQDNRFRQSFLKLLLKIKTQYNKFQKCTCETQQPFDHCIVDLVLLNNSGKKILVEIKTTSKETYAFQKGRGWRPQIKRYLSLKEGDVAYLTTRDIPDPDINSSGMYLGHYYFEDLYKSLKKRELCEIGEQFKEFMEENNMTPPKPFSKKEVKNAKLAFEFAQKCVSTLNEVREGIEPFFKKEFGTRATFTSAYFRPVYNDAYFCPKKFKRPPIKDMMFGIDVWDDGSLTFGTWVKGPNDYLKDLNKSLRWERYRSGWLYTKNKIKGNENVVSKMVKVYKKEIIKLKKAI